MNPKEIERFFKGVAKDFKGDAVIFLTGAAAGALMGGVRPSMDIDFGVETRKKDSATWEALVAAIEKNKLLSGVDSDYSEDIDRWGLISLLDYKKHAKLFKQIGSLTIKILEPAYWSIGKMTRYIAPDIEDMLEVFKNRKVTAPQLVRVWGKALKSSSRSEALSLFRKQVEDFLKTYGPKIWGKGFDTAKAIGEFHKSAGIKTARL